ncbi:hypothetical protein H4219_004462 [Mycoemilia scoparia]|uniref:RGS domain-containing protein n=1 Tax=Mycoemilia scoparia TaxID=417184 RepID=A0A9W7ZXA4_9FUNG|nr:hypothetical protein H4219_004462 [Mycoemilia scoparia]
MSAANSDNGLSLLSSILAIASKANNNVPDSKMSTTNTSSISSLLQSASTSPALSASTSLTTSQISYLVVAIVVDIVFIITAVFVLLYRQVPEMSRRLSLFVVFANGCLLTGANIAAFEGLILPLAQRACRFMDWALQALSPWWVLCIFVQWVYITAQLRINQELLDIYEKCVAARGGDLSIPPPASSLFRPNTATSGRSGASKATSRVLSTSSRNKQHNRAKSISSTSGLVQNNIAKDVESSDDSANDHNNNHNHRNNIDINLDFLAPLDTLATNDIVGESRDFGIGGNKLPRYSELVGSKNSEFGLFIGTENSRLTPTASQIPDPATNVTDKVLYTTSMPIQNQNSQSTGVANIGAAPLKRGYSLTGNLTRLPSRLDTVNHRTSLPSNNIHEWLALGEHHRHNRHEQYRDLQEHDQNIGSASETPQPSSPLLLPASPGSRNSLDRQSFLSVQSEPIMSLYQLYHDEFDPLGYFEDEDDEEEDIDEPYGDEEGDFVEYEDDEYYDEDEYIDDEDEGEEGNEGDDEQPTPSDSKGKKGPDYTATNPLELSRYPSILSANPNKLIPHSSYQLTKKVSPHVRNIVGGGGSLSSAPNSAAISVSGRNFSMRTYSIATSANSTMSKWQAFITGADAAEEYSNSRSLPFNSTLQNANSNGNDAAMTRRENDVEEDEEEISILDSSIPKGVTLRLVQTGDPVILPKSASPQPSPSTKSSFSTSKGRRKGRKNTNAKNSNNKRWSRKYQKKGKKMTKYARKKIRTQHDNIKAGFKKVAKKTYNQRHSINPSRLNLRQKGRTMLNIVYRPNAPGATPGRLQRSNSEKAHEMMFFRTTQIRNSFDNSMVSASGGINGNNNDSGYERMDAPGSIRRRRYRRRRDLAALSVPLFNFNTNGNGGNANSNLSGRLSTPIQKIRRFVPYSSSGGNNNGSSIDINSRIQRKRSKKRMSVILGRLSNDIQEDDLDGVNGGIPATSKGLRKRKLGRKSKREVAFKFTSSVELWPDHHENKENAKTPADRTAGGISNVVGGLGTEMAMIFASVQVESNRSGWLNVGRRIMTPIGMACILLVLYLLHVALTMAIFFGAKLSEISSEYFSSGFVLDPSCYSQRTRLAFTIMHLGYGVIVAGLGIFWLWSRSRDVTNLRFRILMAIACYIIGSGLSMTFAIVERDSDNPLTKAQANHKVSSGAIMLITALGIIVFTTLWPVLLAKRNRMMKKWEEYFNHRFYAMFEPDLFSTELQEFRQYCALNMCISEALFCERIRALCVAWQIELGLPPKTSPAFSKNNSGDSESGYDNIIVDTDDDAHPTDAYAPPSARLVQEMHFIYDMFLRSASEPLLIFSVAEMMIRENSISNENEKRCSSTVYSSNSVGHTLQPKEDISQPLNTTATINTPRTLNFENNSEEQQGKHEISGNQTTLNASYATPQNMSAVPWEEKGQYHNGQEAARRGSMMHPNDHAHHQYHHNLVVGQGGADNDYIGHHHHNDDAVSFVSQLSQPDPWAYSFLPTQWKQRLRSVYSYLWLSPIARNIPTILPYRFRGNKENPATANRTTTTTTSSPGHGLSIDKRFSGEAPFRISKYALGAELVRRMEAQLRENHYNYDVWNEAWRQISNWLSTTSYPLYLLNWQQLSVQDIKRGFHNYSNPSGGGSGMIGRHYRQPSSSVVGAGSGSRRFTASTISASAAAQRSIQNKV